MPPIDNCVSSTLTVLSPFPISNLATPDIPLLNVSVCLRPPSSWLKSFWWNILRKIIPVRYRRVWMYYVLKEWPNPIKNMLRLCIDLMSTILFDKWNLQSFVIIRSVLQVGYIVLPQSPWCCPFTLGSARLMAHLSPHYITLAHSARAHCTLPGK